MMLRTMEPLPPRLVVGGIGRAAAGAGAGAVSRASATTIGSPREVVTTFAASSGRAAVSVVSAAEREVKPLSSANAQGDMSAAALNRAKRKFIFMRFRIGNEDPLAVIPARFPL